MNDIQWRRKAQKQLLKLPRQDQGRIIDAVDTLANFPDCKNIKPLTNHPCPYRLRVGRYRVLFDHDGICRIISIEEVKKRDERTY